MMKNEVLIAKMELRELVDTFSNLADIKDAKSQGELFLPDGVLEFQIGTDGEVRKRQGGSRAGICGHDKSLQGCLSHQRAAGGYSK